MPSCVCGNVDLGIDSVIPTMSLRLLHNFASPHFALGHALTLLAGLRACVGSFGHAAGANRHRGNRTDVT